MKVISRDKIKLDSIFYTQYLFDNGYKYKVFDNFLTFAYTPTGRYPSKAKKQEMEFIISKYEDRRIQVQ